MAATELTISFDPAHLDRYEDTFLATLWHLAQANPAALEDPDAGQTTERIGREIIRRWLKATPPELWNHQGHHYYWAELRKLATYRPGNNDPTSPAWGHGTWTPRTTKPEQVEDR